MTALEDLMVAAKIEAAENDIRHAHNSIEAKRIFGKKHYMAYNNEKCLALINNIQALNVE